ncbi:uncharacterized protein PHALS_07741 [Plasmopara halstedii]|uniref:Uncharacterized protein n=1 Tax=Plasmopara halstedii TaxID=4781 RepID=A0A0N7L8J0_PLAHL|nr:uncharacterized protein PHALS_07741 [Plasmopara halstedii]CEG50011.1 hypothetical protein PHALS_07741 [Plasmopara halstedii]|eukprot:XP_024586380.1 hypothetical protein PHALS_07741 [Plasmopara halstedii]
MATQWMQDACYHATHDVTPSSNESNSNVMCRFIHNQCEKELFTSEYLRSNKASGHKNLRCFPHCCGGHNPKSFCGSGLVIECFLPNCQLVLGRFEEVAKQQSSSKSENSSNPSQEHCSLLIGHTYARQDLFNDVKMPDQPFGRWFRGTSVPNGTTSGMCFLLNGNRQSWHYGWQSSRLNCKNLHVFRVYLFETNGTNVLCIATVASPPFRISSSRKARKTFRTPLAPSTNATPHCHDMIATGKSSTTWYPNISLSTTSLVPSDPTKRERKRLTRSASLKTEYYSTKAFPISTTQDSSSTRQTCSFSSSERDSRFSMPSLPSVDTFFTTSSHFSSRRSSLAALCMPISMENEESPRILTPISGMMDLRLDSSRHLSFTPNPLHQHAYTSARPLPYIRCDTCGGAGLTGGVAINGSISNNTEVGVIRCTGTNGSIAINGGVGLNGGVIISGDVRLNGGVNVSGGVIKTSVGVSGGVGLTDRVVVNGSISNNTEVGIIRCTGNNGCVGVGEGCGLTSGVKVSGGVKINPEARVISDTEKNTSVGLSGGARISTAFNGQRDMNVTNGPCASVKTGVIAGVGVNADIRASFGAGFDASADVKVSDKAKAGVESHAGVNLGVERVGTKASAGIDVSTSACGTSCIGVNDGTNAGAKAGVKTSAGAVICDTSSVGVNSGTKFGMQTESGLQAAVGSGLEVGVGIGREASAGSVVGANSSTKQVEYRMLRS